MPKKQLALLLTFLVTVGLFLLLVHIYTQPGQFEGARGPGEKIKDFYTKTVDDSSSFFGNEK